MILNFTKIRRKKFEKNKSCITFAKIKTEIIMTATEIKNDAINNLMSINSKEFLTQINSILKCFLKIEKHTAETKNVRKRSVKKNAKEKSVKEMSDEEFLDYFCSLPDHNPMTAEEYKKLIIGSRVSGVTRNINYQAFYDAKVSD